MSTARHIRRHGTVSTAKYSPVSVLKIPAMRVVAIGLVLLTPSFTFGRGGAGGGAARGAGAARANGWSGGGASRSNWGGGGQGGGKWNGSGANWSGSNRLGAGQGNAAKSLGTARSQPAKGQLSLSGGNALRQQINANSLSNKTAARAATRQTSWNKLSQAQLQQVHTSLNRAVGQNSSQLNSAASQRGMHNWLQSNPQRSSTLASHANHIRANWAASPATCFHAGWWIGRPLIGWRLVGWPNWGYRPWLGYRAWWYWWGAPGWRLLAGWVVGYGWNDGYYYDYGPDGNVVIQDGQVAVNGEVIGSAEEYSQSAAELAAVDPSDLTAVAAEDWMALGTFSMAVSDNEVDPARVVQLALSKNGLISGTIFNRKSGNTYTVQGRVDKDSQRLAFTIGDDVNTVLETGIFNLTQDESPLLCHFGNGQTQVYFLARLPMPAHDPESSSSESPMNPATAPPASDTAPAAEVSAR